MPDIVDALLVQIGLDASSLEKGTKASGDSLRKVADVGEQSAKRLNTAWDTTVGMFSAARTELLGLVALLTAGTGIERFVADQIKTNSALGRTAHNLRMSTKELGAWQDVMEAVGGSASDVSSWLSDLATKFQTVQGRATLGPLFANLSREGKGAVALTDASGNLRDFTDLLLNLNRVAHSMDPERWMAWANMAGMPAGLANALEMDPTKVQQMLARFRQLAPSEQDAQAAQQMQQDWEEITKRSESWGRTLLTDVIPTIHDVVVGLDNWLDRVQRIAEQDLTGWLKPVADILRALHLLPSAPETPLQKKMDAYQSAHPPTEDDLQEDWRSPYRRWRDRHPIPFQAFPGGSSRPDVPGGADSPPGPPSGIAPAFRWSNRAAPTAAPLPPDVEAFVRARAATYGLDPDWVVALFRQEGGGYTNVSPAGAFGSAQLMPQTAAALGVATSVDDPTYDWHTNADAGLRYLKQIYDRFGTPEMAEAAYNAGPDRVNAYLAGQQPLPYETQRYVAAIEAARYHHLVANLNVQAQMAAQAHAAPRGRGDMHVTIEELNVTTQARDPVAVAHAIKHTLNAHVLRQTSSQLR